MDETLYLRPPRMLAAIEADTAALGFGLASEPRTGALLRTLAASKPGGAVLELGTGTGISAAWILDGMDSASRLITVDNDAACVAVARRHLAADARVTFHVADGTEFLTRLGGRFDLIFADTWPGKFWNLDEALALVAVGGFYVIDDLLPQPNWPADHAPKVPPLMAALAERKDFVLCPLAWSSGIIVAVRCACC